MQILLILVVLMIIMCTFNKTREMFVGGYKGYARFDDAVCKIEKDKILGDPLKTKYIGRCISECNANNKCKGFNVFPQKGSKQNVCIFTDQGIPYCGKYQNRIAMKGRSYFVKESSAPPRVEGVGTRINAPPRVEGVASRTVNQCGDAIRNAVMGYRDDVIKAIMKIQ